MANYFSLYKTVDVNRQVPFKWQQVNSRYEIYAAHLGTYNMDVLIPHCIAVKKRVESTVTTEAHLGPSLYKVFPRTIEGPLPSVWQSIVDERGVGVQHQTEENFDEDIKSFIQEHCPEQCRYQLVQQL
eukprot:CAMPEP_0202441084 /NCGR_PEP_ID=MMETSP1360-20130828/364_1 /ASSEMBLY_ACC=CAM_ASM_000848 /TAXON_ID=515479 /ORGANISM="Licmophora paradoxa, Strain CCMP2313" /LENGTH=127 /DNA_ID=CAMNT_0049055819 /DNA_START=287 /DNA_END=667 /DNA_ORIENTATION=+